MKEIRLAIVGSRDFTNYNVLKIAISDVFYKNDAFKIKEIVSGGAKGADSLGDRFAKENDIPIKLFLPDWDKYGKSAGFRRNQLIVGNCDVVFAFWDGKSKGTQHSINIAKELGVSIVIYDYLLDRLITKTWVVEEYIKKRKGN